MSHGGRFDWCCATAAEVTAHLAAEAPGMSDSELATLPRPYQAEARRIRDAASVTGMAELPGSLRVAVFLCPVCKSGGAGIALCAEHNAARLAAASA